MHREEIGTDRLLPWGRGHAEEHPGGNHREELTIHDSSKEKAI